MGVRTPDPPRLPKHVPAKNAPHFTLPNKDTPKTHPILDPNLWRGTFGGVCFCALHGYVKNPPGFIFPHPDAPKNAPDFTLPNRDTPKTCPILGANLRRGYLRGVCNTPLHGYVQNLTGFIFPHTDTPENAPGFTFSNKDTPKTRPVLGANRRRGTFRGVCFCTPTRVRAKFGGFHISASGYAQNPPDFRLKPSARDIWGVCFCAPTRIHEKFGGFYISAHGCTQNPPDFTLPNKDTPKTRPVLYPNLRRETFRGVCFCAPTRIRA